jgi:hypothetical protein
MDLASSYGCPLLKNISYPETCCTLDETEDCYKRLPDDFGINYRTNCTGRDSLSYSFTVLYIPVHVSNLISGLLTVKTVKSYA